MAATRTSSNQVARSLYVRARRRAHPIRREARRVLQRAEERTTSPLSIFMYHRVASPGPDLWHLAVTPDHFRDHVRAAVGLGDVVPLRAELAARSTHRPERHRRRFALTFDDGYACNYLIALPILESFGVPATFFVSTGFLDQPSFWWDRWSEIAFDPELDPVTISQAWVDLLPDADGGFGIDTANRGQLHRAVTARLVPLHPNDVNTLLDSVCHRLGTGPHHGDGRPLTSDELVEFARHPLVDIGNHSVAHRKLAGLPGEECLAEIVEARRHLDKLLGPGDRLFAYPYGSVNRGVTAMVKRAGFSHALSIVPRSVSVFDHPLRLPRLDPQDIPVEDFVAACG